MTRVDLLAFPGASNWPLWVGQTRGIFERHGIDLSITLVTHSLHMARALHDGSAQIALTSIDNVVAYVEGQGAEVLEGPVDFFAFMGVDDGLLSVIAQPEIGDIASLRGETLAVDAMTTGFAFVLKEILAREGLSDADVTYASVGTGSERLSALRSRACGATLLNAPLCLAAEAEGMRRIVEAKAVLGAYQGIVGAARRAWARDHGDVLEAFIAAFHLCLVWLGAPHNKPSACALLSEKMPSLRGSIERAYGLLVLDGGLTRTLEIQRAGVDCVLALRERHGAGPHPLGAFERYVDDRYRTAALRVRA